MHTNKINLTNMRLFLYISVNNINAKKLKRNPL